MSNTLKHILFLTPGFPADEKDSTTIPAMQLFLKELITEHPEWKVTILAMHFPFKKETYQWHGAKVITLGAANCKFPKRFIYWNKAFKELKKIHSSAPIDLIHSFWLSEMAMLGEKFAKKHNLLHTVTLMGQDVLSANKYFHKTKVTPDRLIAVSKNQNNDLATNFTIKADSIIQWGAPEWKIDFSLPKTYDLINVGSLTTLKNQILFIEIVHSFKVFHPFISAIIIGEGPEESTLKNEIIRLNLEKNVTLIGKISHEKVLSYLVQSKVMIHTSKYESFGFVFNESVACKVPIVSFPVGNAKIAEFWKIAHDKNDFIVLAKELLQANTLSFPETTDSSMKKTVAQYETLWQNKGRT